MVTPRSQRLTISKVVPTCSARSAWDQPLRLRARRKRSLGTNSSELFIDSPPSVSTPYGAHVQGHCRNPARRRKAQPEASCGLNKQRITYTPRCVHTWRLSTCDEFFHPQVYHEKRGNNHLFSRCQRKSSKCQNISW